MVKYIYIFPLLLGMLSCNKQQDRVFALRQQLVESVYASATVQPDSLYQAYSSVSGILDCHYVEEGDEVKQGDPILQIVNTTPVLNRDNAALELKLAKENFDGKAAILDGILDELSSSKIQLQNDSINFVRQARLWEQNIGSKIEYDNRKMAYELSQNRLTTLQNKYDRTRNELATKVIQAENNYRATATLSKDYTIESKIDGKVYALFKNPGELVTTREPVASVGRADKFILELVVDEVDVVKLQLGQLVIVTLDAYSGDTFEALLTKIYPQKEMLNQTFLVEAEFTAVPPKLYAGLAGEGNIIITSKEDALVLPKEYVLPGPKVLTESGEIAITTGLENLEYVEVLGGLKEDTAVLKPK